MKQYIPLFFIILISIFSCSCTEAPVVLSKKAVIEGYVRDGGHPQVIFTSSVVPSLGGNLQELVINWGKVTVSDGDTTVILTGRVDNSGLPPYIYYTVDMIGQPGKTYTVTADFKDLHAESNMTMMAPVSIDSVTFHCTDIDTLRAATVHFTSPAESPAYFYLTLQSPDRDSRPLPCPMGVVCATTPDSNVSLPLLRPRVKNGKYVAQLTLGEEWIVGLNRIDSIGYEFWKAYSEMLLFSTSQLISTHQSLPTNVTGGYGIWSAEGTSVKSIKVE